MPPQALDSFGGIEKTDKVHSFMIMTYAAYRTDIKYRYALVLTKGDKEKYAEIETDSRCFVNVCQERRRRFPGWVIEDSWEIPQPTPQSTEKSLESLFIEFEDVYEQSELAA